MLRTSCITWSQSVVPPKVVGHLYDCNGVLILRWWLDIVFHAAGSCRQHWLCKRVSQECLVPVQLHSILPQPSSFCTALSGAVALLAVQRLFQGSSRPPNRSATWTGISAIAAPPPPACSSTALKSATCMRGQRTLGFAT